MWGSMQFIPLFQPHQISKTTSLIHSTHPSRLQIQILGQWQFNHVEGVALNISLSRSSGSLYTKGISYGLIKLHNSLLSQNHPLAKRPDPAGDAPPAPGPETAFTAAPALAAPHNLALSLSCAVPPLLAGGEGSFACCCWATLL